MVVVGVLRHEKSVMKVRDGKDESDSLCMWKKTELIHGVHRCSVCLDCVF